MNRLHVDNNQLPTKLGEVADVSGGSIRVKLTDTTASGLVFVAGEGYRVGQVGSFVRIPSGYVNLYGVVTQVGAGAAPGPPDMAPAYGNRWLSIELIGEGVASKRFERGISRYPTIGDPVHLVTENDMRAIYSPGNQPTYIELGRVASAESLPAYVDANRLITRHSAIVGSTGSGKSTTVASILRSLTEPVRFPASRILLVDIHGEYGSAFGGLASVYRVNANESLGEKPLYIPYWALNSEEIIRIASDASPGTGVSRTVDMIAELRRESSPRGDRHGYKESATADTPLPFSIHDLWYRFHIDEYATHTAKLDSQSQDTIAWADKAGDEDEVRGDAMGLVRPRFKPATQAANEKKIYKSAKAGQMRMYVDALEARLKDPRYDFVFRPGKWSVSKEGATQADLDDLLGEWLGDDKPITVLDLSGIPPGVVSDLVGILLRIIYESMFWGRYCQRGGRNQPVLVCLEEAHSYLHSVGQSNAAISARRIAKEGRKYGVGLMLISQRPSELDPTILSQCGTLIAMRLTNESDQSQVRSCAIDSLGGLMSMLPVLRTGECIITGEAVGLPVRALIKAPPRSARPDSHDPRVVPQVSGNGTDNDGWVRKPVGSDFDQMVGCWRALDARVGDQSPQTQAKEQDNEPPAG